MNRLLFLFPLVLFLNSGIIADHHPNTEKTICERLLHQYLKEEGPRFKHFLSAHNTHGRTPLEEADFHTSTSEYAHGAKSASQKTFLDAYLKLSKDDRLEIRKLVICYTQPTPLDRFCTQIDHYIIKATTALCQPDTTFQRAFAAELCPASSPLDVSEIQEMHRREHQLLPLLVHYIKVQLINPGLCYSLSIGHKAQKMVFNIAKNTQQGIYTRANRIEKFAKKHRPTIEQHLHALNQEFAALNA